VEEARGMDGSTGVGGWKKRGMLLSQSDCVIDDERFNDWLDIGLTVKPARPA